MEFTATNSITERSVMKYCSSVVIENWNSKWEWDKEILRYLQIYTNLSIRKKLYYPGSTLTSIVYHIDVLMSKSNLIYLQPKLDIT
jgi:hypothetical protein